MAEYESVGQSDLPVIQIPIVKVGDIAYPVIPTYVINGIIPISRGGTGIRELTGGNKFITSNVDGKLMEEVDFSLSDYEADKNTLKRLIAKNRFYEALVLKDEFGENSISGEGYAQTISVPGITEDDNPIIGLLTTATTTTALTREREAYSCIDNVLIRNNEIIVICLSKLPTKSIIIGLNCISPNDE